MKKLVLISMLCFGLVMLAGQAFAAAGGNDNGATHGTQPDCTNPHQGTADGNGGGGGANGSGAYDNTCDGTASDNGNGNSTHEPCAGCVGNADDKNPPGQAPDGTDANNGYECDGNNGVGKTNPAHTGCQPPACDTDCNEIPEMPSWLAVLGVGLVGGAAFGLYRSRRRKGDDPNQA